MIVIVKNNRGKRRLMMQASNKTNLLRRVRKADSSGSVETVVWKLLEARMRLRLVDGRLRGKNRKTG